MSGPQKRILSLIEGYPSLFGGAEDSGTKLANAAKFARIMNARPGHWFLVGRKSKTVSIGSYASHMRAAGYEAEAVNCNIYARVPHPDGVPLSTLVTKNDRHMPTDALPTLADNKFGWSKGEMNNALAMARAWLFPTEGMQAA